MPRKKSSKAKRSGAGGEGISPQKKIAFLRSKKSKWTTVHEANQLLVAKFGNGMFVPTLAAALGLKGKPKPAKKRGKAAKAGRRGPGRPKGKRGPGRPSKKGGARRGAVGSTLTPGWVVVTPGPGRGWKFASFASQEDALRFANEALARGTSANRIGIYQTVHFAVATKTVIDL